MTVTAKLSKELYDRLGERVADELVAWFNAVSTMYRSDLHEFNEINFSRFDAKLEQRLAQFSAIIDRRFMEFEARLDAKMEQRLAAFEAKFDAKLEHRLGELEAKSDRRFTEVDKRIAALEARTERGFAETDQRIAALEIRMERRFADLLKWSFVFWLGTIGAVIATAKLIP